MSVDLKNTAKKIKQKGRIVAEFRDFALRSSAMDLAIGVIIGAAFQTIIKSLVEDLMLPILMLPFGLSGDFNDIKSLFISLNGQKYASLDAAHAVGAPVIAYGNFISEFINLIIILIVVFVVIRFIGKIREKFSGGTGKKNCPFCRSDIHENAVRCPNCTSQLSQPSAGHEQPGILPDVK